jgi:heme/copper-type cytochrome/quinol oxidase subunit 3
MTVPYSASVRPDTGLTNATLGMWLFLASEVMLFGGLFSAYVLLRMGSPEWPAGREILSFPLGLANTGILLTSSLTMAMAVRSLRRKDVEQYWLFMGFTVLLALSFVFVKALEWGEKIELGMLPSTSMFLALYFTLTGVHALHVLGGFVANAYLLASGFTLWSRDPERLTSRVAAAGLYWQFVDVVWIGIFALLYIL